MGKSLVIRGGGSDLREIKITNHSLVIRGWGSDLCEIKITNHFGFLFSNRFIMRVGIRLALTIPETFYIHH